MSNLVAYDFRKRKRLRSSVPVVQPSPPPVKVDWVNRITWGIIFAIPMTALVWVAWVFDVPLKALQFAYFWLSVDPGSFLIVVLMIVLGVQKFREWRKRIFAQPHGVRLAVDNDEPPDDPKTAA